MLHSPDDQPWTNARTRQLLRKKNRNYKIFKKANCNYMAALNNPNSTPETVTNRLLCVKQNKVAKSRPAANESVNPNRRFV